MSLTHNAWEVTPEHGFLLNAVPLADLRAEVTSLPEPTAALLEESAEHLVQAVESRTVPALLNPLKALAWHESIALDDLSERALERLFALYGYFTSTLVHTGNERLPAYIAQPFMHLAQHLERPPMLAYAGMVLTNWRLNDPAVGFTPENITLLTSFTSLRDESWFFQVHAAIEGQAGAILGAMREAAAAATDDDAPTLHDALWRMRAGLVQITQTFHRMPQACDPDVYFMQVRPYLMSIGADVLYEGISPNPTPLRGGSGAQSSVVPALLNGLGLQHESTELTTSLHDMRRYMPRLHRDFIEAQRDTRIRQACEKSDLLRDAYNRVVRQLITFRRAHLYYARTYIFAKSTTPTGTGGTEYMRFLSQLIDETVEQLL